MDTNGVASDNANQRQVEPEAFWSQVSAALGGIDWPSTPPAVREHWLSALSRIEGAVAACRSQAIAAGATQVGAAERTAELVRATGMSGRDAAGVVKTADALAAAPDVAEALAAGAITTGHVDVIVRGLPVGHRVAAMADPAVLAAATSEGVDGFMAGMRGWQARHDRDLDGSRLAARQHADRRLTWSMTGSGMVRLHGDLPPKVGAVVTDTIQAEAERLWRQEDDRAPDPADPAVGRSVAQRNVDAIERICQRANGGGTPGPAKADLQVVVDYETLASRVQASTGTAAPPGRCETSDGIPLAPATVRRLACDAGVIPVVMAGSSQVLDAGRRTRTVTTAQRNALTVRDGGCVFPGCDRPPSWCDAHHVTHWLNHGPTDLWNLVLLCSAHHHAVHEGGWGLTHTRPGAAATSQLVFTDPTGRRLTPEPPAARHQAEPGPDTRAANHRKDHADGAATTDPPTNGSDHEQEQGQLIPARKQVVQRS